MATRHRIKGVKPPTVSNDGNAMLMPLKTETDEVIELVIPHDLLGHLIDFGAAGWNISAKRRGLPPEKKLTYDLKGFECGDVIEGEKTGKLVLTMQFGEEGSISYEVSSDLAHALLEGLKTKLEPEGFAPQGGLKH